MLPSFLPSAPLFLIAGPCAIESRQQIMDTAGGLQECAQKRGVPLIFKSSYDKANRTSGCSPRGIGLEKGLEILSQVRAQFGLPVLTDVHLPQQAVQAAAVVDVLQIPAFLCRQSDLIEACARSGRALHIKKGQFLAPQDMQNVVDKARAVDECGAVLVCERGVSFGYHNLVVDMRALVQLRQTRCPVVFDATHSVQLPGAGAGVSGGQREMIAPLARAAAAAGIDGLFVETHPMPQKAISDAATQLPLSEMDALLESVLAIDRIVKNRPSTGLPAGEAGKKREN